MGWYDLVFGVFAGWLISRSARKFLYEFLKKTTSGNANGLEQTDFQGVAAVRGISCIVDGYVKKTSMVSVIIIN
jgi:hypothetical protein